jgi:hypothetical protein
MHVTYARKHKYRDLASYKLSLIVKCITVDFGFGGKTGHVFCLLICNPSFVILSLWKVLGNLNHVYKQPLNLPLEG